MIIYLLLHVYPSHITGVALVSVQALILSYVIIELHFPHVLSQLLFNHSHVMRGLIQFLLLSVTFLSKIYSHYLQR